MDPVAAFDVLAGVYDQTREPLPTDTVERVAEALRSWEVARLLEVGAGTGRVSVPLRAFGFEVTAADASRGMLAKARAKGLDRLVRGNAYRLPFADGAFDAALFVHVLHVLDDPWRAVVEAQRVGRFGACGLVRPGLPGRPASSGTDRPRAMVIERLRREGIEVPQRASGGPPLRERRLLEEHPPQRLLIVSERDVTEPLAEELRLFECGASRWTLDLPKEALARAVAEVRAEVGDRTHSYHETLALALWAGNAGPARDPTSPVVS